MLTNTLFSRLYTLLFVGCLMLISAASMADNSSPYPGTIIVITSASFTTLVTRVEQAIAQRKMGLVAQASATRGAAKIGVTIPGNRVLMVFRPDYAVRMLKASVAAGIEAPLRIYLTENSDGSSSLTYRKPSAVFAPYDNSELDVMAAELDGIFAAIVADAVPQ